MARKRPIAGCIYTPSDNELCRSGRPATARKLSGVSDAELWSLYESLGTLKRVAVHFGVVAETVRKEMGRRSLRRRGQRWSEPEKEVLRNYYRNTQDSQFSLKDLSRRLGRSHESISIMGSRLGLGRTAGQGRYRRTVKQPPQPALPWSRWQKYEHPRGALGMRHTEENRAKFSERMRNAWKAAKATGTIWMSEANRQKRSDAMLNRNIRLMKSGGVNKPYSRAKGGRRKDIGNRYFRSSWEANIARYLTWLVDNKIDIARWEYEPETFWFQSIKRGARSYTPDFKVWPIDESNAPYYIEVKGWMDKKSMTKLARMKRYHPQVKIELIDATRYASIASTAGVLIKTWE